MSSGNERVFLRGREEHQTNSPRMIVRGLELRRKSLRENSLETVRPSAAAVRPMAPRSAGAKRPASRRRRGGSSGGGLGVLSPEGLDHEAVADGLGAHLDADDPAVHHGPHFL